MKGALEERERVRQQCNLTSLPALCAPILGNLCNVAHRVHGTAELYHVASRQPRPTRFTTLSWSSTTAQTPFCSPPCTSPLRCTPDYVKMSRPGVRKLAAAPYRNSNGPILHLRLLIWKGEATTSPQVFVHIFCKLIVLFCPST